MPKLKPIRIAPTTPNGTKKIVLTVFPIMAFSEKLTPYTILKPILEVLSPRLYNFTTSSMFCSAGIIQSVVEKF